jgi:proteic killer suppression protein
MIQSFSDKETAAVFAGHVVRRLPQDMQQVARRKLKQLDSARILDELKIPPGNRLEALKGNRKGQWSIRINDQWRICFVWNNGDAEDVQIVDYH